MFLQIDPKSQKRRWLHKLKGVSKLSEIVLITSKPMHT